MEPQAAQQNQPHPNDQDSSGSGKGGSFLCRQSSTRWTPTTDQIRILKDLYYNNGVRSPNADQIQRISARLRQYGKIEGKNVFYWFQNHKARERQKKRFTSSTDHLPMQTRPTTTTTTTTTTANAVAWKPDQYHHDHSLIHHHNTNKYPNITSSISAAAGYSTASPSSNGVFTVGQTGNYNYGYGSMTMEKSFRDCSISACGSSSGASESLSHNFGWVGLDPAYSSPNYSSLFDNKKRFMDGILEEEEEEEQDDDDDDQVIEVGGAQHIETLPLFPMHGEDINAFCSNMKPQPDSCYSGWYRSEDHHHHVYATAASHHRTSLELSLNSYTVRSQD